MDFRFTAHDPQTGAFLHRLPRPEKVQIGDTFGTRGTLDLTYSAKALNAKPMPTFVEIRQEVTFDQGMTWAQIGPNYLRLSGSHEDTDQAGMRTVKFVSREWLLGKARVGYGDLPLIDGKRPFYQSSPGAIIRTLLLEAKDRGAAQGIEIGGFTAGKDSAGHSWGKVATIYYQPGLPILNVLENLVEQGLCDYRLEGNVLRLYEPETTMGVDHTTGNDPVRVHGHVTEAPVNYTLEDLTTSALLIGEDGFELEVDNPSAPDDYGRLEVTIEQGGVNQEGTARIMVDEALNKGSREIREITRTQRAEGLKFLPYRDYRVGDFVQVRDQGKWERYRVREIQAVREKEGWTVHTVLNDRLQELLLKLAKRTNGIVNGSQGSGGDGTPPAPPAKPGIEPAAPEGLILDQQVYLDREGIARGVVTAGWGEVTESTKGKAIDIGGYELWWRRNETYATWTRATSTTGETTVSHSPVVLTDTDGTAMEYQWRVRAVAQESARPGPFSDIVTVTMTQDTTPPPPPSMPGVVTDLRIITVDWDGLDEDGEQMPVDFNHVRVYFGSTANMSNAQRVGSLTQAGSWNSGSMEPDTPVWVAISAVDNVGNESAMTEAQEVTPRKLVDDESIRDAIEGIDDAIADAKEAAIEESVVTAGGVTVHNKTTPPVNSPSDKAHDVWQQWTTLDEGGTIVAAWVHDGARWVERDTAEVYVPRINIGEGTFGELVGSRLSAGSVTADKMLIGAGDELVDNPFFDNSGKSWGNADYTQEAALPGRSVGVRLDIPSSGSATVYGPAKVGSKRVSVEAGQAYEASAWLRRTDGDVDNISSVHVRVYVYNESGSLTNLAAVWRDPATFPVGEWVKVSGQIETPLDSVECYPRPTLYTTGDWSSASAGWDLGGVSVRKASGATLIEDGAITTDKILANAITAGKIAALAVEADHISANAITSDKIRAGAIDGKLITGARIRTAASGRRTELDVEGLRSYDSSGNTVLTTQTSDGSIDIRGILSQTISGVQLRVGVGWEGDFPGVQWSDSNIYNYPPGVGLKLVEGSTSKKETLLQGPGVSSGNSFLRLQQRGEEFDLRTWNGTGSSRDDWRVRGSLADDFMQVGSSTSDAPMLYMRRTDSRGSGGFISMRNGDNGYIDVRPGVTYIQQNSSGSRDGGIYLRRGPGGNNGDHGYISLTSDGIYLKPQGSRVISLISDSIYTPDIPEAGEYAHLVRSNGVISWLRSSRRYKVAEEPIETTVESFEDKLLSVDPKTWYPKQVVERYADYLTSVANGDEPKRKIDEIGKVKRLAGLMAEDLDEAGLGVFVTYDDEGNPDAVMYDGIAPALIPIIRRLRDRVDALEQQLGATA